MGEQASLVTLSDLDRRETGQANPSDELGAVSVRDVMHAPQLRLWKLRVLLPRTTRFTRKPATSPSLLASNVAFQCSKVYDLEVWQARVFHFYFCGVFSVFHQVATESVSTASVSNILGVFQLWRLDLFLRHKMLRPEIVGTDEVDKREPGYRTTRIAMPSGKTTCVGSSCITCLSAWECDHNH